MAGVSIVTSWWKSIQERLQHHDIAQTIGLSTLCLQLVHTNLTKTYGLSTTFYFLLAVIGRLARLPILGHIIAAKSGVIATQSRTETSKHVRPSLQKVAVCFLAFFSRPLIRGRYTISATNQGSS
jgi:hypothetical protein